MLMWIWIAVVVVALIVLGVAGVRLLGRLDGLRRAVARLQKRQTDAARLQQSALALQETILEVQRRAELTQEHVAALPLSRK